MVKRAKAAPSQLLVETDDLPPAGFVVSSDKVIAYLQTKTSLEKGSTQLELIMTQSEIAVLEEHGIDKLTTIFAEVNDVRIVQPPAGAYEGTVLIYGSHTGISKLATYIAYLLAVANNIHKQALTLKLTTYRLLVVAKEVPEALPGLTIDADTIFDTQTPTAIIAVQGDFSSLFTFLCAIRHADYKPETVFGVHVDSLLYLRSADLQAKLEALKQHQIA